MRSFSEYQLPITIKSKYRFTETNYNKLKSNVYRILSNRLSHFRVYGVMCPILKKYIGINELLNFFCITISKDRKTMVIDYKKGEYENTPYSTLIKSIDYGTYLTPPKRIFYPLFFHIRRNYAKYLN